MKITQATGGKPNPSLTFANRVSYGWQATGAENGCYPTRGVHAASVIKAFRKNDAALVDAGYSGVPASMVGREQEIEVGPMSGKANVAFWLERRGMRRPTTPWWIASSRRQRGRRAC